MKTRHIAILFGSVALVMLLAAMVTAGGPGSGYGWMSFRNLCGYGSGYGMSGFRSEGCAGYRDVSDRGWRESASAPLRDGGYDEPQGLSNGAAPQPGPAESGYLAKRV